MVPEFDSAAFELPAGQLSELVRSSYGYHIIRVNSHRTESTTPLDQVRARIRQTLLDQRVEQRLAAKSRTIFAQLRRGKHLADVAQAEGLSVAKSTPFARGDSPAPLSSATLVARAFELKSGQEVPEPFALPGGQAFVALAEIRPSRLPELKEVQETVKRDLVERSALERARALADDLRARATTQDLDKAATALGLVRKETPSLVARGQALGDLGSNTLLEEAVFTLAERTVSSPIRVADGYAILRVLEKKPFDPAAFEKEKPSTERSLLAQKRQEFFEAYLAQLWQRYGVERTEAYRRVLGE
jgi:peptidyl-prolyl cis-trans isomerase D